MLFPFLLLTTQPPIEEDDESVEGPSPPLSAGSFVQELFQAQYRYTLLKYSSVFGLLRFSVQALSNTDSFNLFNPSQQVLPHLPPLPEAEQHIRPVPLYLPTHPSTTHQVSAPFTRMWGSDWALRCVYLGQATTRSQRSDEWQLVDSIGLMVLDSSERTGVGTWNTHAL